MNEPEIDTDRIDEAVLALMCLTLHDVDEHDGSARAWKGFEWETSRGYRPRISSKIWSGRPSPSC